MRLWTWQGRGHLLTDGIVDHSKGRYWDTEKGIQEAYAKLSQRIGTDQWVWCFTRREDYINAGGQSEVEWELEVPCDRVLAFVDDLVWNKILGIRCALPDHVRRTLAQSKDEFWDSIPRSWDKLLVCGPGQSHGSVTALIPHPVERSWVIRPLLHDL